MGTYGAFQEIIKERIRSVEENKLEEFLNSLPNSNESKKEKPKEKAYSTTTTSS